MLAGWPRMATPGRAAVVSCRFRGKVRQHCWPGPPPMRYTDNWKYRLEYGLAYKLRHVPAVTYRGDWWELTADGYLLLFPHFMWDGATWFPDFDWMMTPSAIHDALHQAINVGALPEDCNDLIDLELETAITGNQAARWTKRQLLKARGQYVRRATGLVNEKQGAPRRVYCLPPLDGEMTLETYYALHAADTDGHAGGVRHLPDGSGQTGS